jgi:hypothetical protein
MSPLLPLFVALLLSADCATPQYQKDSLLALYSSAGGPFWVNIWNISTDPCDDPSLWFGVGCNAARNSVTFLDVSNNNLTGSLPDLQLPDLTDM